MIARDLLTFGLGFVSALVAVGAVAFLAAAFSPNPFRVFPGDDHDHR